MTTLALENSTDHRNAAMAWTAPRPRNHMFTTAEYRTHWIDALGRCYAQHYPFTYTYDAQLRPVVNLDEVAAWLALAQSPEMRRLAFPSEGSRAFYVGQFLRADLHETERERLAPLIAAELTDDVPSYTMHGGRDWRTPFVTMREQWPLPALGGPAEIRNLTPHAIVIGEITIQPSGIIARAIEESTSAESIMTLSGRSVPTTTTRYTDVVDLPAPQPGVYLVVSMMVPPVAAARGRWTGDLLIPGQQMRDSAGHVIGCRSLNRVA